MKSKKKCVSRKKDKVQIWRAEFIHTPGSPSETKWCRSRKLEPSAVHAGKHVWSEIPIGMFGPRSLALTDSEKQQRTERWKHLSPKEQLKCLRRGLTSWFGSLKSKEARKREREQASRHKSILRRVPKAIDILHRQIASLQSQILDCEAKIRLLDQYLRKAKA